jgi:hypothetical protein
MMNNNGSRIFRFRAFGIFNINILFRNLFPLLSYAPRLYKYCLRVVSLSILRGVTFSLIIFEIGYKFKILQMFEYFSMVEGA